MGLGAAKRKDPRVRVNARVLIGKERFLQQAHADNISISGILIDHLPIPVEDQFLDLFIELTDIPYLGELSLPDLMKTIDGGIHHWRWAFPARAKVARKLSSSQSIDQVFKNGVGIQFVELGEQPREKLSVFILTMIKNVHVLLRLIQQSRTDEREHVLKLAHALGYSDQLKYSELHLKVLKDYQALSW